MLIIFSKMNVFAQGTTTVTGTVVDEKGVPIQGVVVRATTGAKGVLFALTDQKGTFTFSNLKTGGAYTFTASYVGYSDVSLNSVSVNQNTNALVLKMQPANNTLNDVVVIGYGTQKRETVTGAISTVQAKDFNSGQINDPITLIAGKVAGLSLSNTSRSDPNATADFSLRGPATATGNSNGPLVVIDGVPSELADLQTIAPQDIASIDVLKDGSAAAIYGSRATAGVIIITTKKGRPGTVKVEYNGYVTTSTIYKKYDVLDAQQYIALGQKLGQTVINEGANTNWFDAVTRTPISHSHNIAVSGGTDKTNYYASVNFEDNEGIDIGSLRKFVNGTLRLNTKALNDKFELGVTLVNTYDNRDFANYGAIAQSLNENPTFPVYDSLGNYFEFDVPYHLQWNPVASINQNSYNTKENRFLGTVNAGYHFIPSLTGNVTYSLIKNDILNGSFSDINDYFQMINGTNGEASRSEDDETHQILETTLGYDKNFGDHHFNAIAGYSYEDIFYEGFSAGNNDFLTNAYTFNNLGAGFALNNIDPSANRGGVYVGSYASERALLAFFGRIIYNYKEKYLLNVSVRREGASVLGANNKWGTFPGISGGWIMSKEKFLEGSKIIDFLKLRVGYGVTGNQGALDPYKSLETIGPFYSGSQNSFLGTPGSGTWILPYGPIINPNPNLRWETKYETNIGVDFSLLKNNLLSGSLDVYDRKIKDLIQNLNAQLPSQIFPTIFANAGVMENKGIELLLNAKAVATKNFTWNITLTAAYNKNEIESVSNDQYQGSSAPITDIDEDVPVQILAPGEPVAEFYGPVFAKITSAGKWLFKAPDGSLITRNELGPDDYEYLGNSIPQYTYGLTNTFSYGRLDLSILLKGAAGYKALNAKNIFHDNLTYYSRYNLFTSALTSKLNDAPTFSSYYLEDGAYLKAENINIGYTIPIKNSSQIQSIHVYATIANLFTITGFSGSDPELQINYYPADPTSETSNGPGVEPYYSYYPSTTVYTFGVNINF